MNYRELTAIKLTGDLDQEKFGAWLKPYEKWPLLVRVSTTGEAVLMGVEKLSLKQKEEALRRAIQEGLNPEIVLKNEEVGEYSCPFPITTEDHPILNHQETGIMAFMRLGDQVAQVCLKETRSDHLLRWIGRLGAHLEYQLSLQEEEVRKLVFESVIQSCEELKSKKETTDEKIQLILKKFEYLNRKRRQQKKTLHEASFLFYSLRTEEEDKELCGVMGRGSEVGVIHLMMMLFVTMDEVPMLQEVALNQLKKVNCEGLDEKNP